MIFQITFPYLSNIASKAIVKIQLSLLYLNSRVANVIMLITTIKLNLSFAERLIFVPTVHK